MLVGRLCAGSPATSLPSIWIAPSVGCSKPAIIRRVVVLPQPLGPSIVKNSPCGDVEVDVVDGGEVPEPLDDGPEGDARRSVRGWLPLGRRGCGSRLAHLCKVGRLGTRLSRTMSDWEDIAIPGCPKVRRLVYTSGTSGYRRLERISGCGRYRGSLPLCKPSSQRFRRRVSRWQSASSPRTRHTRSAPARRARCRRRRAATFGCTSPAWGATTTSTRSPSSAVARAPTSSTSTAIATWTD